MLVQEKVDFREEETKNVTETCQSCWRSASLSAPSATLGYCLVLPGNVGIQQNTHDKGLSKHQEVGSTPVTKVTKLIVVVETLLEQLKSRS